MSDESLLMFVFLYNSHMSQKQVKQTFLSTLSRVFFKLVPMCFISTTVHLQYCIEKQHEFLESQTYVESYTTYGLPK